jgi:hypothetical protein
MVRIRFVALLVLLAIACRTTTHDDTAALASRGETAGNRLSEYYESLARDTVDSWELSAFRRGFLKLPETDTSARAAFESQYKALRSRARMARRLGNVYASLGRLAAYDTGGEIVGAVEDLETALKNVAESPLQGRLERGAFEAVVKAIASWKADREFRAGALALEPIAAAVEALFRSERELYADITEDRAMKARQIVIDLVKAKEVVSSTLVNRVLASYELAWPDVKQPFADERTISGIVEVIEARSKTFEAKAQDETESVGDALRALVEAHRN